MAGKSKEDLLREQQEEEQKAKSAPKSDPTPLGQAKDELEIAKAKTEIAAITAGYPMPDPVGAWQIDIQQQRDRIFADIQKNAEDAEKNKAEKERLKTATDALAQAVAENDRRQKELNDGLLEINAGKVKIAEVFEQAQKTAMQDLKNFKQRVGGRTIGNIEEAVRILSIVKSSLVKRVGLSYSCPDCQKEDAQSPARQAKWEIPTLDFLAKVKNAVYDPERDEWKLGNGFDLCPDCVQSSQRVFPVTICDICPVRELVVSAVDYIAVGLTLAGVRVQWDEDGVYKPHLSLKEQGDIPAKEWVKKVLADSNLTDADVQQKTEEALGKLAEEEPLVEAEGEDEDEEEPDED